MIWIGRKKICREKLITYANLNWYDTDFTLLDLRLSTDLSQTPEMNYHQTLQNIKRDIKKWSSRY